MIEPEPLFTPRIRSIILHLNSFIMIGKAAVTLDPVRFGLFGHVLSTFRTGFRRQVPEKFHWIFSLHFNSSFL
jgi:hypothetical protein